LLTSAFLSQRKRLCILGHHGAIEIGFITLRAKLSGAVYCDRSCLWVCVCFCVCGRTVTTITRNCVHRSSSNWVCM